MPSILYHPPEGHSSDHRAVTHTMPGIRSRAVSYFRERERLFIRPCNTCGPCPWKLGMTSSAKLSSQHWLTGQVTSSAFSWWSNDFNCKVCFSVLGHFCGSSIQYLQILLAGALIMLCTEAVSAFHFCLSYPVPDLILIQRDPAPPQVSGKQEEMGSEERKY